MYWEVWIIGWQLDQLFRVEKSLLVNSGYNNNLLFAEFATSLRGFDYATLYGTSVAMEC